MAEHVQGQPGPDRAVGRPGPAARMEEPSPQRRRPNVLISPVAAAGAPTEAPARPTGQPAPRAEPAAPSGGRSAAPPSKAAPQAAPRRSSAPPVAQRPPQGAPRTAQPPPQGRPAQVSRSVIQSGGGPRSARLYLSHVDPWSVMKQAFLLSLALAVVIVAASATLWIALESAGVIGAITRTATDVGGDSAASVTSYLSLGKVMGASLVLAGIETVLVTALATLFAFLYNLSVGIGGGLEITLSEED